MDPELIAAPQTVEHAASRRFMVEFGAELRLRHAYFRLLLMVILRATPEMFRTGWFCRVLLTELVVALGRPHQTTVLSKQTWHCSPVVNRVMLILVTMAIPYLPVSLVLGFVPLSAPVLASLALITVLYVIATEK